MFQFNPEQLVLHDLMALVHPAACLLTVLLGQRPCTVAFCKVRCLHGFMKADLRISIKDFRWGKSLRVEWTKG
jgi:hypothetical protein